MSLYDKKYTAEIKELIKTPIFRARIDDTIRYMKNINARDSGGVTLDHETGIWIPNKNRKYYFQVANEHIDKNNNNYDSLNEATVERYFKCLKIVSTSVWSNTNISDKRLLLGRKCSDKGINYKVLNYVENKAVTDSLIDVTLEEVYDNADDYANIILEGTTLKIVGLDGAYSYDMTKIHSSYKRNTIKSNRSLRAAIIDPTYKETINAKGELTELRSDKTIIQIPSEIKSIASKSIKLNDNNTTLLFGEGVESCSSNCLEESKGYTNLACVEISCNKKAGLAILKSINKIRPGDNGKTIIRFNRNITYEEYAYAVFAGRFGTSVESANLANIEDKFIKEVLKNIIKNQLDNLKILNESTKYTEKDLSNIKYKFKTFEEVWNEILKNSASRELQANTDSVIEAVHKQIADRELKEHYAKRGWVLNN